MVTYFRFRINSFLPCSCNQAVCIRDVRTRTSWRPRLQESVDKRPRPYISARGVRGHVADSSAELNITKHLAGEMEDKQTSASARSISRHMAPC